MDIYAVVLGALAGGLAGAIIGFSISKAKNKVFKNIGVILGTVTFIILNNVGQLPQVRAAIMSQFDEHYLVKVELAKRLQGVMEIPEIKAKYEELQDPDKIKEYSRNLVHRGLKRLSPQDLRLWNKTRIELADISAEVCSGLWSGKITESMLFDAMAKLPKESFDNWIEISSNAAKLEVADGANPQLIDRSSFKDGIDLIAKDLDDGGKTRMQRVLSLGIKAEAQDACWMMNLLMNIPSKMDQKRATDFLRFMASL